MTSKPQFGRDSRLRCSTTTLPSRPALRTSCRSGSSSARFRISAPTFWSPSSGSLPITELLTIVVAGRLLDLDLDLLDPSLDVLGLAPTLDDGRVVLGRYNASRL